MKKSTILIGLLLLHGDLCTGSHSLWIMGTYIRGRTPFPEFTVYLMLDDIEYGYYDSNENKLIHRDINDAPDRRFDAEDVAHVAYIFEYMYGRVKGSLSNMKNFFNHTNGIDVFQRAFGCELLDNDHPGPMFCKDGYNGESVVVDHYDADNDTLHTDWKRPDIEGQPWAQKINLLVQYKAWYYPDCIRYLRKHLAKEKNRVLKKVKPRVRMLQETLPDSDGAKVTCLATGFYPRHINLTLLRDGQPVSDHQITGGELLPNVDETYQMRKSLEVSAEELKKKHNYTCTAEHLSLDNKLNVTLDLDSGVHPVSTMHLVIALLLACVFGTIIVLVICYIRRCTAVPPPEYAPALGM